MEFARRKSMFSCNFAAPSARRGNSPRHSRKGLRNFLSLMSSYRRAGKLASTGWEGVFLSCVVLVGKRDFVRSYFKEIEKLSRFKEIQNAFMGG